MAYKDERVVSILLEQAEAVEERVPGYRRELQEAVADIIHQERQNKFARTNVAVKVADIVGRVGTFLNHSSNNSD